MRKGCLLAAAAAGLFVGSSGRCSAMDWGATPVPGAGSACPACAYPPWGFMPGGHCLHIGWYGCAPPSNYHPIVWSVPPAESARMVRERLAIMNIFPPPVIRPEPPREVAPPPMPDGKKMDKPKPDDKKIEEPKTPEKKLEDPKPEEKKPELPIPELPRTEEKKLEEPRTEEKKLELPRTEEKKLPTTDEKKLEGTKTEELPPSKKDAGIE